MKTKSRSGLAVSVAFISALSAPTSAMSEARAAEFGQFKVRPEQKAEHSCDDSPGSQTRMEFRRARCPQGPENSGAWLNAGLLQSPLMLVKTERTPINVSPGIEDQRKAVLPSPTRLKGRWIQSDGWNSQGPDPPRWLKDLWKTLSEALRPSNRAVEKKSQEAMYRGRISYVVSGN